MLFPLGGNAVFANFCFSPGWGKPVFFRFPIKNYDFSALNGYFYQKIAIFLLPMANSVKKLRFFDSRRSFLQKTGGGFAHPRGRKRGNSRFLFSRGLRKLVFRVFCSSEGSESLFFVFSVHPRPRKVCFSCFLSIRGLGKSVFRVFCPSEGSAE